MFIMFYLTKVGKCGPVSHEHARLCMLARYVGIMNTPFCECSICGYVYAYTYHVYAYTHHVYAYTYHVYAYRYVYAYTWNVYAYVGMYMHTHGMYMHIHGMYMQNTMYMHTHTHISTGQVLQCERKRESQR